ncbi:ParB/RepB/Spo0J family partition protein [Candidatus Darwinibacter acetoxidans]
MIETTEIPLAELRLFHKNPRVGNVAEIAKSLTANGQYRAIVVNKGTYTGRPMEVLAGNHTVKAARDLGWEQITAHLLDVDEDQASRIVLADNRTAELGEIDTDMLLELAGAVPDLEGTGYSVADLAALDDVPEFFPDDAGIANLDSVSPRLCQNCGYDTANNPKGLEAWQN